MGLERSVAQFDGRVVWPDDEDLGSAVGVPTCALPRPGIRLQRLGEVGQLPVTRRRVSSRRVAPARNSRAAAERIQVPPDRPVRARASSGAEVSVVMVGPPTGVFAPDDGAVDSSSVP